jgi:hypothetical protein
MTPDQPGTVGRRARPPRAWRVLAWLAVAAALAAVFMSYRQPELMIDLANRLWSCF